MSDCFFFTRLDKAREYLQDAYQPFPVWYKWKKIHTQTFMFRTISVVRIEIRTNSQRSVLQVSKKPLFILPTRRWNAQRWKFGPARRKEKVTCKKWTVENHSPTKTTVSSILSHGLNYKHTLFFCGSNPCSLWLGSATMASNSLVHSWPWCSVIGVIPKTSQALL